MSLREVSQLRGIYIHHRNMHKNVNISAEASPTGFSFLRTIKWGTSAKNELWQKCFFPNIKPYAFLYRVWQAYEIFMLIFVLEEMSHVTGSYTKMFHI